MQSTIKSIVYFAIAVIVSLVSADSILQAANHPHIVIILVDDMGYGDPCCYNAKSKIPTPNIDGLAEAGIRFSDAHASGPLCHMSRYGLMTGQYPFRVDTGAWRKQPLIANDRATIASVVRRQGYRTAMVGKWHCGFAEKGYDRPLDGGPVDVGFDSFFGIRASTDIPPYFYIRGNQAVTPPTDTITASNSIGDGWTDIQGAFWRAGGIAPDLKLDEVLPRFTQEAMDVIHSHKGKDSPLMLYLAFPAPHTPWLPADEFRGKSRASLYGDFMVMVDAMIGRVLKTLDACDMADDTLVVFSSDNGPVWYEEDVQRFNHDASGGLRGMKSDAWECGHRMPFIVRWPGQVIPGSVSSQLISFVDLLSTFAELTGVTLQENDGPDSISFLAELRGAEGRSGPAKPKRESLVLKSGGGSMTVREGDWKFIDQLGSGGFSKPSRIKPVPGGPTGQLYNLADDVGETTNLFSEHPEVVARLQSKLKGIVESGRSR